MAAGTVGGALRITAGRLARAGLAGVVGLVVVLAAPTAALATTGYDVTFGPGTGESAGELRYQSEFWSGSCDGKRREYGASALATYAIPNMVWMGTGDQCRDAGTDPKLTLWNLPLGQPYDSNSTSLGALDITVEWTGRKFDATSFGQHLLLQFMDCTGGAGACTAESSISSTTVIDTPSCSSCGIALGSGTRTVTMPAGTERINLIVSGNYVFTNIRVEVELPSSADGDCAGSGSMAGGGSMVEVDWGSIYSSSFQRCISSTSGSIVVDVLVAVGSGVSLQFYSDFCTDGNFRTITVYFLTTGGIENLGAMRSNRTCSMGDVHPSVSAAIPEGTYGVKVIIEKWVLQSAHHIDVFGPEDGGGFSGGGSGTQGVGTDCVAPADGWLDLDWLGYVGCVLLSGFSSLGDLLGSLPGIVASAIGDVLEYLFVPTTLEDSWSGFWDALTDRVPFGWVAQGYAAISGVSSASGAAMAWVFTIDEIEVPVPFAALVASAAPYRGWLAAVVVAGTALTVWRSVSGSGESGQMSLGL